MFTRQQIQTANDIVKSMNIMQDLLNCVSWQINGIDPKTGGEFKVASTVDDKQVVMVPTVEELKDVSIRSLWGANLYYLNVKGYLDRVGREEAAASLSSIGLDIEDIETDLVQMKNTLDNANVSLKNATEKTMLVDVANTIDAEIPKLVLIRRPWSM